MKKDYEFKALVKCQEGPDANHSRGNDETGKESLLENYFAAILIGQVTPHVKYSTVQITFTIQDRLLLMYDTIQ